MNARRCSACSAVFAGVPRRNAAATIHLTAMADAQRVGLETMIGELCPAHTRESHECVELMAQALAERAPS